MTVATASKRYRIRQYQRPIVPPAGSVHRLIHFLWAEIVRQQASQEDVAVRAGVSSSAMRKWRRGDRSPNLCDVEACLNVLGFSITVRKKPE